MANKSPRSLSEYISRSTMKREISAFIAFWWMVLGTYLMARLPITQFAPDAALVTWYGLTPFVFGLVGAAFGADWVSKQTNLAGPPSNTETTITTEQTPTGGETVTTSSTPTKPDGE